MLPVTPAPLSPLFKTISLSAISVSVELTVVCVPATFKLPVMVTVCVVIGDIVHVCRYVAYSVCVI